MASYEINSLVWQTFFVITMFLSTFISYLLPIIIFTRNRHLVSERTSNSEDIIYATHHGNNGNFHRSSFHKLNQSVLKHRWKKWLSYCNCISTGVFLGVCFLNLVPCVEEEFSVLIKDFPALQNLFQSFPLGQFNIICGLFFVLFLEYFLSRCFRSPENENHERPILYLDEESTEIPHEVNNHLEQEELLLNSDRNVNERHLDNENVSRLFNQNENVLQDNHHHHHYDVATMATGNDSMFSFFILMFATSVHSLFEGLALGLQSNLKTALHLFIGIILHECLVAIAIGLNAIRFQQENIQLKTHLKFAIVFSMNIPLGNILGIILGYTPGHIGRFISAIFQGFAAGTFIHVTFFELIPEEFIFNNKDLDNHHQYKNGNVETDHHHYHRHHVQNRSSNIDIDHINDSTNSLRVIHDRQSSNLKLQKISLVFLGFIMMALVAFIFSE